MKVCLFGGTFDPPHVGHLIISETIKESEGFDKMIFVPAFQPPHKEESPLSSVEDRLEMLRLSLGDRPNLEVSNVEIKRGGVSYTIDTIREVKRRYGLDRRYLTFLIGSDSLVEFHTWRNHEAILKECRVLVASRPGFRPSRISPDILSRVRFANMPQIEISSSEIRRRVRQGLSIRYMVSEPVRTYIRENSLYVS
ncbi:MAG: nicotinate (nicotinamide) nucleotide adenylyltransferase [Fidelibacterota bacterium]